MKVTPICIATFIAVYNICISITLFSSSVILYASANKYTSEEANCKEEIDTGTGGTRCGGVNCHNHDPARGDIREKLPFPPSNLLPAKPFPKVHIKDLYKKHNEDYFFRRKPFILTNAADDWKAVKDSFLHSGRRLAKWFPRAVVDFYPMNMLATGSHPYLFRLKQGLRELEQEPGSGRFGAKEITDARGNPGKYLHNN
jgi:hypothetical protein